MKNIYTVISLGNYESKILSCTFIDNKMFPIYVTSFLTKNCLDNSRIIDKEMLINILNDEIKKMPVNITDTKLIINIPIKNIKIKHFLSSEYVISTEFNDAFWKDFLNKFVFETKEHDYVEIDKKFLLWNIEGKEYLAPPYGEKINNFSFKMKSYLVEKEVMNEYIDLFKDIYLNVDSIVCDSLVMHELFKRKDRRYKVLLNIGHLVSSLETYDNMVLIGQKTINFGIRDLTLQISKIANVNEEKAIEILKIYKDLAPVNKELPLVNHFKEKYLEYSQTTIEDISQLIIKWLKDLINHINSYFKFLYSQSFDADEIYIYSSTNVLGTWINYIKPRLLKYLDLICLESEVFGINESKFLSLIASAIQYRNQSKK